MINTLLYIGAGKNVTITKHFPQVEKFVFLDTNPRASVEHGKSFDTKSYDHNFFRILVTTFNEQGFVLKNKKEIKQDYQNKIFSWVQKIYYWAYPNLVPEYLNPHILYFHNGETNQLIKYYMSTNILFNWSSELEADVKETDGLIIYGSSPDVKILSYFDHPIKLYIYSGSNYKINSNPTIQEKKTLFHFFNKFPSQIPKYICEIYLVLSESGDKFYCNSLNEIEQVELFNSSNNKNKSDRI
jgi:hypothetical protein